MKLITILRYSINLEDNNKIVEYIDFLAEVGYKVINKDQIIDELNKFVYALTGIDLF